MRNKQQPGAPEIYVGCLVIAIGVLFLLDNLGIINVRFAFHFWPMVFIVAGLLKLGQSRTNSGVAIGAGLVAVGVLLMLKKMGLIYLSWTIVWPLLFIVGGGVLVMKALRQGRLTSAAPEPVSLKKGVNNDYAKSADNDDSFIDVSAVLGGYKRRVVSQDFRGGEVTAMMAGCELDLRKASIQSEAVLTVFAMCGGITVKVPIDWTVIIQATPILGGFDEKTSNPPDASKRLVIRGYAVMGGVEVRN